MAKILRDMALLVLCALCAYFVSADHAAYRSFISAKDLERGYRWTQAMSRYKMAMELSKMNASYAAGLGDFIMRKSSYRRDRLEWLEEAERMFRRAMTLDPYSGYYAMRIGQIYATICQEADRPGPATRDSGKRAARMAMTNFALACSKDPQDFNTSYVAGYTGLGMWKFLSGQEKTFVVERLAYSLMRKPGHRDIIYSRIWKTTGSYKVLAAVTAHDLESNKALYSFIIQRGLWALRAGQAERVDQFLKRADPQGFEISRKREEMAKKRLAEYAKPPRPGESISYRGWQGAPADSGVSFTDGCMYWNGTVTMAVSMPRGRSRIKIKARGDKAAGVWPYMIVELDGRIIGEGTVDGDEWRDHIFEVSSDEDCRKALSVTFVNDYSRGKEDRNLYVGDVLVEGI